MTAGVLWVAEVEGTGGLGSFTGRVRVKQRPLHRAEWINFSDEDPRKGFVKGMITVGPAKTETDVTHYTIFWASNKTTMDLIISLPVGIYEHNLVSPENEQKGVPIPPGANQFVVKTSNAAGMMEQGTSISIFDFWRPALPKLLKGLLRG
ncbi:unnamed protein product [Effrenium voratum]|nr:unnamed protein product [Effrenium voratum]